jgi:hypothetical protein
MHWFQLEVFAALAAWSLTSAAASTPLPGNDLAGKCPINGVDDLVKQLSKEAKLFFPGSDDFLQATFRWSSLDVPKVNMVVVPGIEKDVAVTVGTSFRLRRKKKTLMCCVRSNSPTSRMCPSSRTTLLTLPCQRSVEWTTVSRSTSTSSTP